MKNLVLSPDGCYLSLPQGLFRVSHINCNKQQILQKFILYRYLIINAVKREISLLLLSQFAHLYVCNVPFCAKITIKCCVNTSSACLIEETYGVIFLLLLHPRKMCKIYQSKYALTVTCLNSGREHQSQHKYKKTQ